MAKKKTAGSTQRPQPAKKQTAKAVKKSAKKASTRKRSTKRSTKKTSTSKPSSNVTIRMYCQGLGDCFLLRFPRQDDATQSTYVMIDCGVIIGTEQAPEKMAQVVDDIIQTTNGKIDLLIVTHEHWDHLSGFVQVKEKFKKQLHFETVWLAWTEDPSNQLANQLRQERKAKLKALRAALTGLLGAKRASLSDETVDQLREVENLLAFFGPTPSAGPALAAAASNSTEEAMQFVTSLGAEFLSPGHVKQVPGSATRAYVLGPPQNVKLLKKDAPGKGKDEAYELTAALAAFADDESQDTPRDLLFPKRYRVSNEAARNDPFFRLHYGFRDDPLGEQGTAWQRIDEVWLEGASQLALKLDSDTNNTSLVLAFELPDGRTLIFPGDAQIGNWLSWSTATFPKVNGRDITSKDLLNRAVVYKVGHHGSHNATLKAGGLEEMTSGDLVALIPVNEKMAQKKRPPKTGWKMPFSPLYERLQTLTGGRILRADTGKQELDKAEQSIPANLKSLWKRFRKQVEFSQDTVAGSNQPLYVDYTVE
ncbi:MBL fold metallo-hydrolase [bacterium]|nr:MBL fold metallo-hydrolase [bacterium]